MSTADIEFLQALETVISTRKDAAPNDSYTARLLHAGVERIAQKVGEEGVEVAIAAATNNRDGVRREAADLIYHLLVLLASQDLTLADIAAELKSRQK